MKNKHYKRQAKRLIGYCIDNRNLYCLNQNGVCKYFDECNKNNFCPVSIGDLRILEHIYKERSIKKRGNLKWETIKIT